MTEFKSVYQIIKGNMDNLEIIFHISPQKHVVTPHLNRPCETDLMWGQNMF